MTTEGDLFQLGEIDDQCTMITKEDDSCSEQELNLAFNVQYYLGFEEQAVSSKSTYVLHICGNSGTTIAAGLSDNNIKIYDIESLSSSSCYGHEKGITGLRFSPKNAHLLYSSSLDGSIKLWDMRERDKSVAEFKGNWTNTDGDYVQHPLSSFDVCNRDRVIVGGTESVGADSFLLFWDVRAPGVKPIGGYWESHTQDITQVKFHLVQSDMLATGSMDGLINVFDIRQGCEEDALTISLNTDSTVDKITWLNNYRMGVDDSDSGDANLLSCITHEETLQIWRANDASPVKDFSRDDISKALKVNSSDDCYIVDVYHDARSQEEAIVLCGSTKNECLRMLCLKNGLLNPWACLRGTSQVVRCCWCSPKDGVLATGGQGGIISLWRPGKEEESDESLSNKGAHKIRAKKRNQTKNRPY